MDGWIKLHKKFFEWEWYNDNNVKILFIHLLLKANFIDKEWKGIMIKRGQLFTSILHLSKEVNLTVKQVRISLHKICVTGEITEKGASNGTMITICNYDSYQQEIETKGQTKGKPRANEGQQHKNITIKEEYKESFILWLKYKKERKESYKSEESLKIALEKLNKLSDNDELKAMEIVKNSIANNWSGLFELKTTKDIKLINNEKPTAFFAGTKYELRKSTAAGN